MKGGLNMSRIDENCINHNVVRLTKDIIEGYYDCLDEDNNCDHQRIAMIATIDGINLMAQTMKEVLRS